MTIILLKLAGTMFFGGLAIGAVGTARHSRRFELTGAFSVIAGFVIFGLTIIWSLR